MLCNSDLFCHQSLLKFYPSSHCVFVSYLHCISKDVRCIYVTLDYLKYGWKELSNRAVSQISDSLNKGWDLKAIRERKLHVCTSKGNSIIRQKQRDKIWQIIENKEHCLRNYVKFICPWEYCSVYLHGLCTSHFDVLLSTKLKWFRLLHKFFIVWSHARPFKGCQPKNRVLLSGLWHGLK